MIGQKKAGRVRLAFILILFVAFTFRLWNLGTQSLWHDEAWSVFSAYHPLAWGAQGTDPNAPPIFYITLSLWQHLAGDSVWAMRYWSLLVGWITVAVVIRLTRVWFGINAALLTGFLAAISPILWVFSQEIRAYVAMPLLALILLELAGRLIALNPGQHSRRVWLWLLLTETITLYTHNLAVPLIAWLNVTVIVALLWRREWRKLRNWIIAQAGLALAYLPWLITQRPTGTALNTPPTLDLATLWNIWQSYFTGIRTMLNVDPALMALTALIGLLALVALLAALALNHSRRMLLVLSQSILVPVFELGIILAAHIDFHPRYFIVGVVTALIMIGVGLGALAKRQPLMRLALAGTALLAVGLTVRMTQLTFSSSVYQHDDFRTIAQRYATLGSDDAIIIPYGWEPTLDYYSRKMEFKARFINVPLHANADTILDTLRTELQGVQRAEFLTWYQLPADVRGAYACILSATGQAADDSLTVQGLTTDRYHSFLIRDFAPIEGKVDEVDFGTLRLTLNTLRDWRGIWGINTFCAISHWQLAGRTDQDWRVVIHMLNVPLNWEIGKADTQLLNDQQLPTSLWSERGSGTAFNLLKLPEGLPSEPTSPFFITTSVYSSQTPQGVSGLACERNRGTDPCYPDPGGRLKTVSIVTTDRPPDPVVALQPSAQDIPLDAGAYLHRADIPNAKSLQQGECPHIALEFWRPQGAAGRLLVGARWRISGGSNYWQSWLAPTQQKALVWFNLCIPDDATGSAVLETSVMTDLPQDPNPIQLAEYTISEIKRTFTEPEIGLTARVGADFGSAGQLIGARVDSPSMKAGAPFSVTLLWKAAATWADGYTIFVHLLDANGQVIAQSDSVPANGERPMTNWLAGEYITDPHTLTWNRQDYTGPATLEVGMYSPNSGDRAKLSDGSDHVLLPGTVMVRPVTVK